MAKCENDPKENWQDFKLLKLVCKQTFSKAIGRAGRLHAQARIYPTFWVAKIYKYKYIKHLK